MNATVRQLLKVITSETQWAVSKHLRSCSLTAKKTKINHYVTSSQCAFEYTYAITRELPKSFAENSLKLDPSQQIVLSRTVQQLDKYVDVLKRCGLEVITLPADEDYPDCVFVEDAALVIGQKACLTRPGHPSRRGEVEAVKDALQSLGITTQELDDPSALVDGGDILFTGQEILLGMSTRSNKAAAESLQRTFPEFPVTPIPIHGMLHLKSAATLAQDGVLLVGGSEASQEVLKIIQTRAQGQYRYLQVSQDKAANVLFLNGHTVIKPESDIGSADFKTLTSGLSIPWITTEFDEFYKADGCLTCCSILICAPQFSS